VAYPDVAIGPLLFFKRIKANLFYDVTRLNSDLINAFNGVANTRLMQSTGVELTFNVRALRLLEIDMGVRYSYLLDANIFGISNPHKFDFLLFSIGI
jgi:outer membrane receptor protein involved in Fe transport